MSAEPSAFAPLRHRVFAVLWIATVVSNVGGWMRDTTSAWLMTSLDPSPSLVALIQAASTLPIFLLSLPAGAFADIVDRRRMMIVIQAGLAIVSLALALFSTFGAMTPGLLLGLTLLAGIGAALANPVWQSIVPELVPKTELRPAVALNSLGFNISRAIGPALGGVVIAAAGIAAAYAVDVLSYTVVLAALIWWRRAVPPAAHPEAFSGALRAGVRFAVRHPPLQRAVLRAILFFLFGSAYWALLPLVVRVELRGGPEAYGLMLGAVGLGAVIGALLLPRLRGRLGGDGIVAGGTFATAVTTALLALVADLAPALAIIAVAGGAWIAVMVTLNSTVQAILPDWVRARGLAIYLMAVFGAMTAGSTLWGQVAQATSLDTALYIAGGGLLLVAVAGLRLKLPLTDADLSHSDHWPDPTLATPQVAADAPAWVTIEYRVSPARQAAFTEALAPLAQTRRRDGAIAWGAYVDLADPARVVEWFVTPSWAEHLRQHDRVLVADKVLQAAVNAFHEGPEAPRVAHHIALGALPPPGHAAHLRDHRHADGDL